MHALLAKPLPSAQVHQARAEARAEAEAAAEQRLAALDRARREEREAAVRAALALGAARVRAPGSCHRGLCYTVGGAAGGCAILSELVCTLRPAVRQCAEQLQSAPSRGPGMISWRGGACCTAADKGTARMA